jgi:hypothetical protein
MVRTQRLSHRLGRSGIRVACLLATAAATGCSAGESTGPATDTSAITVSDGSVATITSAKGLCVDDTYALMPQKRLCQYAIELRGWTGMFLSRLPLGAHLR